MSNTEALVREYMECFNSRDWDRYRGMLHPEYSYTGGDGDQVKGGPDVGLGVAQMFANAMSDAKIDVKKIYVAGDTALVEFIGSGTHDGDFQGIAPTGKKVTLPVCDVVDVRDGKIIAEREYMDMMHMMQQLGVVPAAATA
ncbi:MAG: ester cyclase [Dehalococcoidia bacterium]